MRDKYGRFAKNHKPTHGFKKGHKTWNKKPKIEKICFVCKTIFYVPLNLKNKRKHCSQKCHWESMKGGTRGFKKGNKHWNWKNGKTISNKGYVLIHKPNHPFARHGYIRESRFIVEQQIKRYLTSKEVVHHEGGKTDNSPHMLICFKNNTIHLNFHAGKPINPSDIIFDGRKL